MSGSFGGEMEDSGNKKFRSVKKTIALRNFHGGTEPGFSVFLRKTDGTDREALF